MIRVLSEAQVEARATAVAKVAAPTVDDFPEVLGETLQRMAAESA